MSGILICKKHGRQMAHHTCEHLNEKYRNGIFVESNYIPLLFMEVCDECNKQEVLNDLPPISINEVLDLPENEQIRIEAKFDKAEKVIHRKIICKECYKQLKLEHERKMNSISEKIIKLKNADLELRNILIQNGKLEQGYNEEMEAMHNRNARKLNDIINEINYPTIDKVGEEASEAAWLIVQHSIGQPEFMKKCLQLLEKAVSENKADPKNLAYLTDRIAVFEGKHQLYGTQFDWDENGKLNPNPFDNLAKVNQRRKSIGLNTLQEQTEVIRKQAEIEHAIPPENFDERKNDMDAWRKKVGWIK